MQTANFWNKLHLYRYKIIILTLLGLLSQAPVFGQNPVTNSRENLVGYDNRLLTYGFTLGVHTSSLRLKYSDSFVEDPAFADVANVTSPNGFGFSIGFLGSLKLAQYLDLRLMPKVGFYQYSIDYQYTTADTPDKTFFADFTTIDLPLLFKFKSQRRKNFRMFYVAGVSPTIDVTGKKQREENEEEGLQLSGDNLSLEVGFGTDLYFPLFKFSPEIRYSYGLVNVLKNNRNEVGMAFDRMNTQSIALYLIFN